MWQEVKSKEQQQHPPPPKKKNKQTKKNPKSNKKQQQTNKQNKTITKNIVLCCHTIRWGTYVALATYTKPNDATKILLHLYRALIFARTQ